jgi:hypothetical protein
MRQFLFYGWCLAVFLFWSAFFTPAAASDPWTRYDAGCRLFVSQSLDDISQAVYIGQCMGAVRSIMVAGPIFDGAYRFCPPTNASTWQGAKVMLKYVDDNPAKMNEDFFIIGLIAFRAAWPCQHR